jgi:hypothetical protein
MAWFYILIFPLLLGVCVCVRVCVRVRVCVLFTLTISMGVSLVTKYYSRIVVWRVALYILCCMLVGWKSDKLKLTEINVIIFPCVV